jgi:signal transduction histidine kinase
MFRSLRGQLILSHIIPSLLIIPLMGIALVYILGNRFILPNLVNQLADDALVIGEVARQEPGLFQDTGLAQKVLAYGRPDTTTRVMILDTQGRIIGSSDPTDENRIHTIPTHPELVDALNGQTVKTGDFSQAMQGEVVDVFVPVFDDHNQVLGIIRMTYRFATVFDLLLRLRYLIFSIFSVGIVFSAFLGLFLAFYISRPIQNVTHAIRELATGHRTESLPEQGPMEIESLQQSANFLVSRLHDLEADRRQLLVNLVHELGRPLGGLRTGIQVLRRGAKDDPEVLDELLEGLEEETSLLRHLLEDLSQLHDHVLGVLELDRQPVKISDWLDSRLGSFRLSAAQKGLEWRENIPEDLPEMNIDPLRIGQVVGNLINNAIKYTPRRGTVTISAGKNDREVWIRVEDTGPGIPGDELKNIFVPFFRGSKSKRIKQGMGLGLTIAKDLTLAHQGRLTVDSKPGSGSKFTIWLPLDDLANP